MSYILDALKKADQERAAGNVPDLETVHLHEPTERKHYRWLWILAALFIFNGVLVTLLATRHDLVDAPGRHPAPDDRISSMPDTTRSRPPAERAPVVRQAPPPRVVRTTPSVQERPRGTVNRPVSPRVQSATVKEPPVVPPVAVVPPNTVAAPPSTTTTTTASAGKLPEWDELSLEFRSGFSMPHMDVHVYDTDPSRRFVLVNLQKFREGDRLPNGAVIEQILPDGMQLSYQGTRFHYTK